MRTTLTIDDELYALGFVGPDGGWELWVEYDGCWIQAMVANGAAVSRGPLVSIPAGTEDVSGVRLSLPNPSDFEPIMEVSDERYQEVLDGIGRQQWYLEHARTEADRQRIADSIKTTRKAYSIHEEVDAIPPEDEQATLDALDAYYRREAPERE